MEETLEGSLKDNNLATFLRNIQSAKIRPSNISITQSTLAANSK
jgi:hypothetical protein